MMTSSFSRCTFFGGNVLAIAIIVVAPVLAQDVRVREHDPGWRAPTEHTSRANPLAKDVDLEAGGRKLFGRRCTSCHGDDGRGTTKAPDLTQPAVQVQSDGALFWKISGGNAHKGMPAFSFLPRAQRWQLVMHLRALAHEPGHHPGVRHLKTRVDQATARKAPRTGARNAARISGP